MHLILLVATLLSSALVSTLPQSQPDAAQPFKGREHTFIVKTADKGGAGTDETLRLVLTDTFKNKATVDLEDTDKSKFEQGAIDTFQKTVTDVLGAVINTVEVCVGSRTGDRPNWIGEFIKVNNVEFPVPRELKSDECVVLTPNSVASPSSTNSTVLSGDKLATGEKAKEFSVQIKTLDEDNYFNIW